MFPCLSSGVPPSKASFINDMVVMLPQNVWDHLYSRYVLQTAQSLHCKSPPRAPLRSLISVAASLFPLTCTAPPQVWRGTSCQPPVRLSHVPGRHRETGETTQVRAGHVCQGETLFFSHLEVDGSSCEFRDGRKELCVCVCPRASV